MKIFKRLSVGIALMALAITPSLALAQSGEFRDLNSTLSTVSSLIVRVIPLIIGAAVIVFLWGILNFIFAGSDEGKRTDARKFMVFGVIALAVMVSIWGLVNFVRNTVGINGNSNVPTPPGIPGIRN